MSTDDLTGKLEAIVDRFDRLDPDYDRADKFRWWQCAKNMRDETAQILKDKAMARCVWVLVSTPPDGLIPTFRAFVSEGSANEEFARLKALPRDEFSHDYHVEELQVE